MKIVIEISNNYAVVSDQPTKNINVSEDINSGIKELKTMRKIGKVNSTVEMANIRCYR